MQTRSSNDALGIDVSSYQGSIDWPTVKKAGISFASIKATEGTNITDNMFATNYADAKRAGILRGAYHFARPSEGPAVDQANHFLDVVNAAGGVDELPAILDVEDNGGLSPQALTSWVQSWVDTVKSVTNKTPLIYTYPYFAETNLETTLSNLPLWIAEYGVSQPQNVNGWTSWTFWQYSDTGTVNGITGNVDLDVYNGSVTQLQNAYQSTPAPQYTQFHVFVLDHPYVAIAVGGVTYVIWTALNALGTPHTYKGNGLMDINGKDVQGVVYQGNTYLPWDSLASGIHAEKVWHFYTS